MKNPFKATKNAISDMYSAADECDYFDHVTLKVLVTAVIPIVGTAVFFGSMFEKDDKDA